MGLDDVWLYHRFVPQQAEDLRWMKDDRFYTELSDSNDLVRMAVEDPGNRHVLAKAQDVLGPQPDEQSLHTYSFSPDESRVLLEFDRKPIYRRSYTASVVVLDLKTKARYSIMGAKPIWCPSFSPDNSKLVFCYNNDLYLHDFSVNTVSQLTSDGYANHIINGSTDWVHEEEFAFVQAYSWSPDSRHLFYYRFDERRVKEFSMDVYKGLYPQQQQFKYPKAGEQNAHVDLFVLDIYTRQKRQIDLGLNGDWYYPRHWWVPNQNTVLVYALNRRQNEGRLLAIEAQTGNVRLVLTDTSATYLTEPTDNQLTWAGPSQFVWQSERSGWNQLYLYGLDGKFIRRITPDGSDVTQVYGVDPENANVYYQLAAPTPMQRQVAVSRMDGRKTTLLTESQPGWNGARFSSSFRYFIHDHSSRNTPTTSQLRHANGKVVRSLVDNKDLVSRLAEYRLSPVNFIEVPNAVGQKMNGWMIRPVDFDLGKKYPVLLYVYGGPGSQTVEDQWDSYNRFWYQHLADQGYVVISVDGRGTGARGRDYKKCTYLNMGKLELEDQLAVARWVGTQSWADATRLGIWGWSFGGYMTALALTKGNGLFRMGISVAPVTNWRLYDTIYTERYLNTPQENAKGYDDNSPARHANQLKGKLLLVHGTADDNVHVQNSMEFINELVKAGKQFDMFMYPNRNHGIYGGNTRHHLYTLMTNYIKANL